MGWKFLKWTNAKQFAQSTFECLYMQGYYSRKCVNKNLFKIKFTREKTISVNKFNTLMALCKSVFWCYF